MPRKGRARSSPLVALGVAASVLGLLLWSVDPWATASAATQSRPVDPRTEALGRRPGAGLTPAEVIRAYGGEQFHRAGIDGRGTTVVVVSLGHGYRQASLDAFTTRFGLPPIEVEDRGVDSRLLEPTEELEMDLEVIHSIAPGARLVVYSTIDLDQDSLVRLQEQVLTDQPGVIVSQSWSVCESYWTQEQVTRLRGAYERAAKAGGAVFASTGDSGAFECLDHLAPSPGPTNVGVGLPAAVPEVTAVGGTRLTLTEDGSYGGEAAWQGAIVTEGTGGGSSSLFASPEWQPRFPGAPADAGRSVPDVSADAETGVLVYLTGYGWTTGGGTSQAAPIWAGVLALIDNALAQDGLLPVRPLNEGLYRVARDPGGSRAFRDIVLGSNLRDPAGPGYDRATGLGSPNAWELYRAFAAMAASR